MRVHWCHRASSKRRCHKMSLITTTTGSRCGLIEHHDADCAPPDDQAARFQQRSRRNIVIWSCAGHPRQQKRQNRPVVAAAGTEANPVQQRQPNYGREEREVRLELCVTGCYYGGRSTSHAKAQRRTRPDTATRGDTRDRERELASELPRTEKTAAHRQEDEGPDRPSPPHQDYG